MTNEEFLLKFRVAFPELSKAPDERVLYFYELAQNSMAASVWAKQYQEGILNLGAHMLTLKYGLDGNGLPITAVQQEVTSKAIGKISKGMGSKNSDIYAGAGDYASTVYGRRYWELLRLIKPTGMLVNGFGGFGCAGTFSRGSDGLTPHIGYNSNWGLGDDDTGQPARGEQGERGLRGEQGERGLPGERGIQGLQGAQGIQGLPGVKGDAGERGAQGERGLPGADGAKGDKGSDGLDGKDGLPGGKGADGLPGKDGADGKSAYQIAVAQGFAGSEAAWLASLKGEKGDKGDAGAGGSGDSALQLRIAALEQVLAKMPKYKEYQAGYIPRADFVGTLANNGLITANYPKPFSKRPILNVTLDIADAAARVQYVNNATETGFQVATNYAASMSGVWYEAFILEN